MVVNKKSKEYRIAKELADMYIKMKEMSARLQEIIEEYDLEELEGLMVDDIQMIEACDHSLIAIAHRIVKDKACKLNRKKGCS